MRKRRKPTTAVPVDDAEAAAIHVARVYRSSAALARMLSNADGRMVLQGILEMCGVRADTPTDCPVRTTDVSIGIRRAGLWIQRMIEETGGREALVTMEAEWLRNPEVSRHARGGSGGDATGE